MAEPMEVRSWDSKAALLAHLQESAKPAALVGAGAEAPRKFYSFSVAADSGSAEIGVISSGLGTAPHILSLEGGRRALVGHDTWLTWVDLISTATVEEMRLNGVFYAFAPLDGDTQALVLHELGALRVGAQGQVIWTVDTDVVEDWQIDADGNLVLTMMDQGLPVVVASKTGKIILA